VKYWFWEYKMAKKLYFYIAGIRQRMARSFPDLLIENYP
jgi:hypothetical protein